MAILEPFNTKVPISGRGMTTFRTIAARLAAAHSPVFIEKHIAQERDEKAGKDFSTLVAHDSTLDGINFKARDPELLANGFHKMKDGFGQPLLTSMKEEPDHWALKASFKKTPGSGWREPWRPVPYLSTVSLTEAPAATKDLFRMRFGTAGRSVNFTALHCAVDKISGNCNIHIDESGFVLGMPHGTALTPDFYDHLLNELLFKTDFRDWLEGLIPNQVAAAIVKDVIRRLAFQIPNAGNRYAGWVRNINSTRAPRGLGEAFHTAWRILGPTGITFDTYDNGNLKVQVTGTWGGGDRTIAVTVGGMW